MFWLNTEVFNATSFWCLCVVSQMGTLPTKQVSLCCCQSVGDSADKTGVFVSLSISGVQCLQNRCLCVVVSQWGTMPTKQVSLCRCQSVGDSAYKTGVFVSLSVSGGQCL